MQATALVLLSLCITLLTFSVLHPGRATTQYVRTAELASNITVGECFESGFYNGTGTNPPSEALITTTNASECQRDCNGNAKCSLFSWRPNNGGECYLRGSGTQALIAEAGSVSGPKACNLPNKIEAAVQATATKIVAQTQAAAGLMRVQSV